MAKKAEPRKVLERTWAQLHAAFVSIPDRWTWDDEEAPNLAALARQFDVPLADARQRAASEYWELEWEANHAWRWHRGHGYGAKDEAEFIEKCAREQYAHLCFIPEGRTLAEAIARETWRRAMGPALQWEARQAEEAAERAYDEATRRQRCA